MGCCVAYSVWYILCGTQYIVKTAAEMAVRSLNVGRMAGI
jgi:hypothetical protein